MLCVKFLWHYFVLCVILNVVSVLCVCIVYWTRVICFPLKIIEHLHLKVCFTRLSIVRQILLDVSRWKCPFSVRFLLPAVPVLSVAVVQQAESGYGSENNLRRHGSVMSITSATSLSTASSSSFNVSIQTSH